MQRRGGRVGQQGLYLSLKELELADGTSSELWAESSLLVSRGQSGASFGRRVDFDWFFGSSADIRKVEYRG